jgi:hypothetical protein
MSDCNCKSSKIYCLKSRNSKKVYIGSCSSYLSLRKAQHKYYFNQYQKNGKISTSSTLIYLDDEDPEIILCEEVDDKSVQRKREQFWIDKMKEGKFDVVNNNLAVYSYEHAKLRQKEKYKNNPEYQKKKSLQYYYNNRHRILQKSQEKRDKQKKDLQKLKEIEAMNASPLH